MEWYKQGPPSFTSWVYGEPDATQQKWPGSTCALIEPGAPASGTGQWSAQYCRNNRCPFCMQTTYRYDFTWNLLISNFCGKVD